MSSPFVADADVFPLLGGRRVVLHSTGLLHPRSFLLGGEVFTPYVDITHLASARGALRMGTRQGVFLFRRKRFREAGGADRVARALLGRIAAHPEGAAQMARMADLEEQARMRRTPPVCLGLVAACLLVALVEWWVGPAVAVVGAFSASLLTLEPWRAVVAHFLHGFPGHLAVNALVILVMGPLAEWPLGAARTGVVLGFAGAGAMAGSTLAGYELALGASGLASGLVGAALWLELRAPERLSALWRIPRRFFLGVIALQVLMDSLAPFIAQAAHVGGFFGGWIACALVARSGAGLRPSPAPVRAASLAVLVLTLAGFAAAAHPWLVGGEALARRTEGLLSLDRPAAGMLNDYAWILVTRKQPGRAEVGAALRLAERAVESTQRQDPNLLDTLAEAQFAAGSTEEAVATIDEAIALAPEVDYFQEQRRRYRGERSPEDRPEPPTEPWVGPAPGRELPPLREDSGIPI